MKATIVLDKKAENELEELGRISNASRSELVRTAVEDLYLKEKRAREGFRFFIDQYLKGVVPKDMLFLLLPRRDAEAIIIGSATGKEAAEFAKKAGY
ncbi:MAG: hypothetical protein AABX69_04920 [Nanoarchaeota archaeon]